MLQDRCSKCNLPLENEQRQIIGLGDICEVNARLAYDEDVKAWVEKEITGDNQFNWLAIMGNTLNLLKHTLNDVRKRGVVPLLETTLERLSLALASHQKGQVLPWQIVLDCFSIARNNTPEITKIIHQTLNELGFNRFIALASGDFCLGNAKLSFDNIKNRIILDASIRRSASEVFNLLWAQDRRSVQRPQATLWTFSLKHAQVVLDTVKLRFPLPESLTIMDSFYEALKLSKNLPPEEEEADFMVEVADMKVFSVPRLRKDGSWAVPYNFKLNDGSDIYSTIMASGGSYYKAKCNDNWTVYLIPEDKEDKIKEYVEKFFNEIKSLKVKNATPNKTIENGAVKKTKRYYR